MTTTPGKRPRHSDSIALSDKPGESGDQKRVALSVTGTVAPRVVDSTAPAIVSDASGSANASNTGSRSNTTHRDKSSAPSTPPSSTVDLDLPSGENPVLTSGSATTFQPIPVSACAAASPGPSQQASKVTRADLVDANALVPPSAFDLRRPLVRFKPNLDSSVYEQAEARHLTYDPEWIAVTILFGSRDGTEVSVADANSVLRRYISTGHLTLHSSCDIDGFEKPRRDAEVRARVEDRSGNKVVVVRGLIVRISQSFESDVLALRSAFGELSSRDSFSLKGSVQACCRRRHRTLAHGSRRLRSPLDKNRVRSCATLYRHHGTGSVRISINHISFALCQRLSRCSSQCLGQT